MPDYPPVSQHHAGSLTFRRRSGADGTREFPFCTGQRRLADTLIEFATGGGWQLDDLDAGVTLHAPDGRVLVVPAERSHELRMKRGRAMDSQWALVALEDELGRDVLARLRAAIVLPPKASHRAVELLTDLQSRRETTLNERITYQRIALELMELILAQAPALLAKMPTLAEQRIENVLRFVHDHLNRPLTLRDLARQAYLSPARFHCVFAEATGQAPMKYLTAQRIRRAGQLLLSTTLSSKEVGQQCGFVNAAHFSRTFTRAVGLSPLMYRAQIDES